MLRTLRGFLPWIAFAVINALADWRIGAPVAFVLGVALLIDNRRTGHHLDEAVIELSAALFFLVIGVVAFVAPHSPLKSGTGALSAGWLAVTAWGSLAVRRPFTMGIARRSVPREFWDNPRFYRANAIITSVWAAFFTLSAIVQAVADAAMTHPGTVTTIVQVACYVLPAVFTIRYQESRRRAVAQIGATS